MKDLDRIIKRTLIALTIIIVSAISSEQLIAKTQSNSLKQRITRVKNLYAKQKYDTAIIECRKILRKNPKQYEVWELLGASYYYAGVPLKALKILIKVSNKTNNKTFNHYHQGLALGALKKYNSARRQFTEAARGNDEFSEMAIFELTLMEYRLRNRNNALFWSTEYRKRFYRGRWINEIKKIEISLRNGVWTEKIQSHTKANKNQASFLYSKFSLSDKPHYWYSQAGYNYNSIAEKVPIYTGSNIEAFQNSGREEHNILVNVGIGAGPLLRKSLRVRFGYSYFMIWNSDPERLFTYAEDPLDISWFPWRADLLERHHQLYVKIEKKILKKVSAGLLGSMEIATIGAKYFPGPTDASLKQVLKKSETILIEPFVKWKYIKNQYLYGYLYLRQNIDKNSPDLSNRSHTLLNGEENPGISLGMRYHYR
ncbi:MAG: hypothetical protein CMP10_15350, partial [Zetaproteobacteria bacterium]|nr:hypothetical protein [Pseudobdellovibrionaceae bacterium]